MDQLHVQGERLNPCPYPVSYQMPFSYQLLATKMEAAKMERTKNIASLPQYISS
jgi:hypothetical protein